MTREEAVLTLKVVEEYFEKNVPVLGGEAMHMAIDALRVHQSTPKLDRNQWKECFVCKGATWMDGDICISGTHYSTLAQFNFCPDCGRPLTDEAWVELEKRIGGSNGTTDLLE